MLRFSPVTRINFVWIKTVLTLQYFDVSAKTSSYLYGSPTVFCRERGFCAFALVIFVLVFFMYARSYLSIYTLYMLYVLMLMIWFLF